MIETFKRFRLQKKGLSCGKKRRERESGVCREFLCSSPTVMGLLLALGGMFFGWLVLWHPGYGVPFVDEPAKAIFAMMLLFLGAVLQFSVGHPESFQRNNRLLLVLAVLGAHLGLMKIALTFVDNHFLPGYYKLLLVPYGLAPMALTILLGRSHGLFATFFVGLWGLFLMPEPHLLPWLATSLTSGLLAVVVSHEVRKRKHVLRAGLTVGLAVFALAILLGHMGAFVNRHDGWAFWRSLASEGLLVVGISLATGIVISSLLPLLESTFRLTTAGTWMEMADLNHPLLRRMTIEAPGTYHHSLMVANLAEAAAETIGARSLMTRVAAYFHDIGKLKNPEYFIENTTPEDNPHDDMTPSMSALVIISHVKDGVDLALRHKLNHHIVDVIEQHHGTSLAAYFYQRAIQRRNQLQALADADQAHETDVPEVDEATFRYPGPKPQSRESAIISLADALESASRSMEKPTPAKIEQLVEDIVKARILDGQLDDCGLTLGELALVKKSFVTTLRSMLHKRVSYTRTETPPTSKPGEKPKPKPETARGDSRFQIIRGGGGKVA